MKITEEDWKVVEARLQYDVDNNIGTDIVLTFIGSEEDLQ